MRGAGLTILAIAAAACLSGCGKRQSIYLDHMRDEASAPARKAQPAAPKPAQAASTNSTETNAAPAT